MVRWWRLGPWMAVFLSQAAWAQSEDEAFLDELLAVVEESTALAQEDRLNADYVPGMISVLDARRQEALGARTVHEALAWVPGLLTFRAFDGEPFLNVRGISSPFNSGNVKILVDGVALNQETSGVSSNVLHMPLAQVQHIEVVRGPGGVLYGDSAFNGVVNIISRRDQDLVFTRAGEPEEAVLGAVGEWASASGGVGLSWNLSGSQTDEPEVPGDNDGRDRRAFVQLGLRAGDFRAELRTVRREFEPARARTDEISDALILSHQRQWTNRLSSELAVSQLQTDHETPGRQFEGRQHKLSSRLAFRQNAALNWQFLATVDDSEVEAATHRPAPAPSGGPGSGPPQMPPVTSVRDLERRAWGAGVQLDWAPDSPLGLTLGLRFDDRDDIDDSQLTPRLGLVWRASDRHLFKLQYTEGFRVPTFFELISPRGRVPIGLEKIGTTELSYIYRSPQRGLRLTSFYSHLNDLVAPPPVTRGEFANLAQGYSRGAELEWEENRGPLGLLANVSYSQSGTDRVELGRPRPDGGAANWLGNLGLSYDLGAGGRLGAHLNYIGERESNFPGLGDQVLLHLTYSHAGLWLDGLDLRLGMRNLLHDVEPGILATAEFRQFRIYHESRGYLDLVYRF